MEAPDASTSDTVAADAIEIVDRAELAPTWALRYGTQFWRRPIADLDVDRSRGVSVSPGIDIGDVVDRVSHAIRRPGPAVLPRSDAASFTATFDGRGLRFSPHRPAPEAASLAPLPVMPDPDPVDRLRLLATQYAGAHADPATEARIHTARIAIGDRELYRDDERAVPWSLVGNTAQGLLDDASGLVAHAEVRGEGVELTWVLRERPATGGELVVDLAVEGLSYSSQSERGTHFADASGISRMRVSEAVLVDARGERWPIVTEIVDGNPRWRVPAAALAMATFPVALDPTVGPEFGTGVSVIGTAPGGQAAPAVAASASGYLVVWHDNTTDVDITGARVTNGIVEDVSGIAISTATGQQSHPAVASDGTDYYVVWNDLRNANYDIYGARVTAAGTVATDDTDGIPITTAANNQMTPSVASNGSDYFVAWDDRRGGTSFDIYGARITAAGAVPATDVNGIAIATAAYEEYSASVASNGTDYLVAWNDVRNGGHSDIYAARVTAAGSVPAADASGIPIATATNDQRDSSVVSNRTDYLVTWYDSRSGTNDIYGARVTALGAVPASDANGIPISTAANHQLSPSATSNGTDYFVVWQDLRNGSSYDVYGARVTAAGTIPTGDAGGIPISTATSNQTEPVVASNGTDYLVAWTWLTNASNNDVYGARVSAAGTVEDVDAFVISTGPNAENAPAVAASETGFLLAWVLSGAEHDIWGARVSTNGVIEDVSGIAISTAASTQYAPSVASNGTDYLVAWQDRRDGTSNDVYGARVTATGTIPAADDNGIPIATAINSEDYPSIASNGTDYLVTWMDARNAQYDIYGARVTASGVVPASDAAGIPIATRGSSELEPTVASNGTDYLVAWRDFRSDISRYDIYGARVTAAGAVPTADLDGIAIAASAGDQATPSVASNGTDYLVVWQYAWSFTEDIYGARVNADGTVPAGDASGIPISTATNKVRAPSVSSNGTDYLVVWEDNSSGSSADIYGARVAAAGTVEDPSGFAISTSVDYEAAPAIAGRPGMPYLVAYQSGLRTGARLITDCGDGELDGGESCDDGDVDDSDGCSAACTVEPGYTCSGLPSNCIDTDECATNNGGCDPLTVCTNNSGSFTCGACPGGYAGAGSTGCTDVDECATNNGGCAQLCANSDGAYACSCSAGYTPAMDGLGCDDVDECATNNGGCAAGVTCTNMPGSFTCGTCPPGYTGDGTTCTDVDECATNNAGCTQSCTNVAGSYTCGCADGYTLNANSHGCDDIDECATANGGCDPRVTCTNTPGSRTCGACPAGYSGGGDTTCADIDECAAGTDGCASDASCTNTEGGFTCACVDGFDGDGVTCAPRVTDSGCGCHSAKPRETFLVVLVLALCLWPRRRRRVRTIADAEPAR